MSASNSSSDQQTSSATSSVADSYNNTYNRVTTVSSSVTDSGNVSIGFPDNAAMLKTALPWIFGVVAVLGAVIFLRR